MDDGPKIVIQCAASKRGNAGSMRLGNGRKVMFVAKPQDAPQGGPYSYANPDGASDSGETWREKLLHYNALHHDSAESNPLGLLPAWKLYSHPVYTRLADIYGPGHLYILSAGWGLIRADFLTPNYNITFSNNAESYKRRRARDVYGDWRMLPVDTPGPILFFGGQSYICLFCSLTKGVGGLRYVFYSSQIAPDVPGCQTMRFHTRARTNWHYECAQAFIEGKVRV